MDKSIIAPAKRVAVVSLNFSPAFVSHMMAYGKLFRDLGFSPSFMLHEKYLLFADFSAIGPQVSVQRYVADPESLKFDTAIFCNAAVNNSSVAHTMRARGIEVLYVFHEPAPISLHLSEGWKEILKLIAAKYCSIAMLRQSSGALVPSRYARDLYDRYFAKYNPNVYTLPLLFDDECNSEDVTRARPGKQYFSFLGYALKAHDFDAFIGFAKYAIRAKSTIVLAIATRTDLSAYLARDKELSRYAEEGRIRIQHGRMLSNEEMNQYCLDSFCVWNLYKCCTQSGVLVRAFMAGSPVIAMRMGSFPEYVVPGVNGEFIDSANDFIAMLQAAEKIRANNPIYVAGCRRTFMSTFYYGANRETFTRILKDLHKENQQCESL
jgi:glycosyltransferase involved in cell wall biosynthesis